MWSITHWWCTTFNQNLPTQLSHSALGGNGASWAKEKDAENIKSNWLVQAWTIYLLVQTTCTGDNNNDAESSNKRFKEEIKDEDGTGLYKIDWNLLGRLLPEGQKHQGCRCRVDGKKVRTNRCWWASPSVKPQQVVAVAKTQKDLRCMHASITGTLIMC